MSMPLDGGTSFATEANRSVGARLPMATGVAGTETNGHTPD